MLTLLLASSLGACGGGDDGTSKDDFIEQADKLCAETNEEGTKLAQESFEDPTAPTPQEAQNFVQKAVPIQRELLAELRALERPAGDEDEIEAWLDATDEGTDKIEEMGQSAEDSLTLLRSNVNPLSEANDLAADYGLSDCAS